MVTYRHVIYNYRLQGIGWALEQVSDKYRLLQVVPYSDCEGVAVFQAGEPVSDLVATDNQSQEKPLKSAKNAHQEGSK